jgi:Rap1a immunity proteins
MKRFIAVVFVVPAIAHAEFWSGNDLYTRLTSSDPVSQMLALGYIVGAADATTNVSICPPRGIATTGQTKDIVYQFLTAHPETRHYSADSLVNFALKQIWPCADKGKGI